MEDSEAARAVSLQAQFQFPSYPYQTLQRGARCVVSVRAEDGELDRAPIDLCAVVDRCYFVRQEPEV